MRYLIIFFLLLAGVFQLRVLLAVAQSLSFASSSSRFLLLQHIEISYDLDTDSIQLSAHNSSAPLYRFFSDTEMEEAPLKPLRALSLSTSDALTYKIIPRHSTQLMPRGSRTLIPLNTNGEHALVVSRAFGHLPPRIGLLITLTFYVYLLTLTAICLVYFFSSPPGIRRALENLADGWQGLVSDAESLALHVGEWLLWTSWTTLTQVDGSIQAFIVYSSEGMDKTFLRVERILEERKIRQWEKQALECIIRKLPKRRIFVIRPFGRHWTRPLFRREIHGSLTYLFLPEEESCPMRHMYDPRYFNQVKKIGAGAFGYIYQVEHRITGKMMAMKVLVRRDNPCDDIDLEIRAMVRVQGEHWYPKLLSTFMDADNFYILMPFYARGDLYTFMKSCGGCLHRDLARFYLAELLLAIQCLHKMGIVHRDLKPENILFEEEGHLIVADFGVAHIFPTDHEDAFMDDEYPLWEEKKRLGGDEFPLLQPSIDNPHMVTGIAGTPYYAAPEVVENRAYSYGVDYYSMAMLYHEMVTGFIPLRYGSFKFGATEPQLFLDFGRKDVHFQPMSLTDLRFMEKMLDKDPYSRPTVRQMKAHPVLAGTDWLNLSGREVPVPPPLAVRRRVPISHSIDRCLTES